MRRAWLATVFFSVAVFICAAAESARAECARAQSFLTASEERISSAAKLPIGPPTAMIEFAIRTMEAEALLHAAQSERCEEAPAADVGKLRFAVDQSWIMLVELRRDPVAIKEITDARCRAYSNAYARKALSVVWFVARTRAAVRSEWLPAYYDFDGFVALLRQQSTNFSLTLPALDAPKDVYNPWLLKIGNDLSAAREALAGTKCDATLEYAT